MFLGLGFGTVVCRFRVYGFRVRVLNHCFQGLGFMFLGLGFGTIVCRFRVYVFRVRVWRFRVYVLWVRNNIITAQGH